MFTQRRLGAPCFALVTSPSLPLPFPPLSFALSFLLFCLSLSLQTSPFVGLRSTDGGDGGAALLRGSPGSGDVNQSRFLQAFLK